MNCTAKSTLNLTKMTSWYANPQFTEPPRSTSDYTTGTLSHKPLFQGQPGETKTYWTMRQNIYWIFMAVSISVHVQAFLSCVKGKYGSQNKQQKTNFFLLTYPLDYIAIFLHVTLSETRKKNKFINFIIARCSKLTHALTMTKPTDRYLASVLLNNS